MHFKLKFRTRTRRRPNTTYHACTRALRASEAFVLVLAAVSRDPRGAKSSQLVCRAVQDEQRTRDERAKNVLSADSKPRRQAAQSRRLGTRRPKLPGRRSPSFPRIHRPDDTRVAWWNAAQLRRRGNRCPRPRQSRRKIERAGSGDGGGRERRQRAGFAHLRISPVWQAPVTAKAGPRNRRTRICSASLVARVQVSWMSPGTGSGQSATVQPGPASPSSSAAFPAGRSQRRDEAARRFSSRYLLGFQARRSQVANGQPAFGHSSSRQFRRRFSSVSTEYLTRPWHGVRLAAS
ncbi:hypothetical protein K466DRAFT_401685 [Polyporus arcularius HHB13444]|uniref:Uncharacterized protein n=1 Tax=Polyporus arcularius HHB13444 TaxID=1314778 RepID=A0A5C3NVE2_9APHY|nr:hypothetical protein K466DRAFT_401685 [Polyporus arcularius HHB13444]